MKLSQSEPSCLLHGSVERTLVRPTYLWSYLLLAAIFLLVIIGHVGAYQNEPTYINSAQSRQKSNSFYKATYIREENIDENQSYVTPRKVQRPWYERASANIKTTRNIVAGTKGDSTSLSSTKTSPRRAVSHFPVDTSMLDGSTDEAVWRGSGKRDNKRKHGRKLVCYYGSWAVYRPDAGKFPVESIDPFLCTHVIYAFAGLSYDGLIKPLDPWNDLEENYGKGAMKRFTNLKKINPELKTLVAIGGWNEGSVKYSNMVKDPETRARFIESVLELLRKFNFDGLDFDWEYPAARGGKSYDKQNFVSLLRELRLAFKEDGYMLTAAVSAGKLSIDPAYNIPQVSKYLDLINLMTYDFHGGWETKTGMNAPLFSSPVHDSSEDKILNVNFSVNYWIQNGANPEKIVLGVGSYGRSFTLDNAEQHGINAPASQKGQAGPYTREPSSLGYNEICESFQRHPNSWTVVRDPYYLAPYAYNGRQWVGYDDVESLKEKTQYAKSMGLGGMMMWSIETDDFHGTCHGEKYPLLKAIKRELASNIIVAPVPKPPGKPTRPSSTTTTPSTTTGREVEDERPNEIPTRPPPPPPSPATTNRPTNKPTSRKPTRRPTTSPPSTSNQQFTCTTEGMFADPNYCTKFHRCVTGFMSSPLRDYTFDCAPGTAFSEQLQICDFIANVPSCKNL